MNSKSQALSELDRILLTESLDGIDERVKQLGLTDIEAVPVFKRHREKCREEVKRLTKHANELRLKADLLDGYSKVNDQIKKLRDSGSREALDMLEANFPEFFKSAYPRRFEIPSGFHSPKQFALTAFFVMHATSEWSKDEDKAMPEECLHITKTICALMEKMVPTYFVSEPIMEALTNTDLPKDFTLAEMPWPLDSMLFVLPKGMTMADGDELAFVVSSRIEQRAYGTGWMNWGRIHDMIRQNEVYHLGHDAACLVGVTTKGRLLQWEHTLNSTSIFDASNVAILTSDISKFESGSTATEPEQKFTVETLPRVAFQLILAMLACPEMIEGGIVVREPSNKKGKIRHELWSPNFFGKSYRKYDMVVGSPNDDPVHRRPHWRRGHFRHQRHGQGNTGIRVVWIKPVLINKAHLVA